MRNHWRMVCCLIGVSTLYGLAGCAMGQPYYAAPQFPQYVQYPQTAPPVTPVVPAPQVTLNADQLDQLLGPIALYPDPLLSLIFPASTFPQDVAAAAQWLAAMPNPTEDAINAQSWDASIKGLVHYPTVLNMMAGQLDWMQAVGAAFVNQQQDVMDCIQRLRGHAQAANNLQNSAQVQIVNDDGCIRVEPVDPNMIYVPQYDPNLVYFGPCPITFGIGFPIGLWCDNDFDWHHHGIVVGAGWYQGWHHPEAWDRNPPAWNRRPAGWVAAPRAWARPPLRPAPRLSPAAVSRLRLDQPRRVLGVYPNPDMGRRLPAPAIGREPTPEPGRGAFDAAQSRADVQHAEQRAHPGPVEAAPARARERAEPAPREPERTPPQRETPAPQPERSSVYSGGSSNETRADSDRGNASSHR